MRDMKGGRGENAPRDFVSHDTLRVDQPVADALDHDEMRIQEDVVIVVPFPSIPALNFSVLVLRALLQTFYVQHHESLCAPVPRSL